MPAPAQQVEVQNEPIRMKVCYGGDVMITSVDRDLTYPALREEMKDICKFDDMQPFTMKWLDEEGDPCTISCQIELDEALRLYDVNNESEVVVHVFPNIPQPGHLCAGEDRNIYRRGARRWRKLYRVNGHRFQAKRFGRRAVCAFCSDHVWGLGRQGYKCITCKMLVHKKCHKLTKITCGQMLSQPPSSAGAPPPSDATGYHGNGDSLATAETNENASGGGVGHGGGGGYDNTTMQHSGRRRHHEKENSEPQLPPPVSSGDKNGDTSAGSGKFGAYDNDAVEEDNQRETLETFDSTEEEMIHNMSHNDASTNENALIGLKDFELLRVIGRGSYAKVFMVEQRRTKRYYAMKVIKKELVNDDEDIDWVQTEKHVFEVASNHPFLVGLHSCFQSPSRLFFVIEFVNGGDLMFHMQRQRRLPEEHARFYSAEICLALNFLHEKGILYRDLKLDNVLLDSDGHIKLTDYGMCKEGLHPGDCTSTFCGTPNYIAPEMLRGEDYDFSVDWWALGVLMFEMLAGRSPFDIVGQTDNPDQNTEDYLFQVILEKPIRIPRSLSVKASSVLKGFLNKTPQERLGCDPQTGFADIQGHPFFRQIDWDMLYNKQITPPYKPPVKSETDLEHFDPQFTNEPVQLTPDDQSSIQKIDQSEFEGFEYVNPLLMSQEDCV